MKSSFLIPIVAIGFLTGCGQKNNKTGASDNSGGSLLTAPVDYLNAAGKAEQSAVKTVDTTSLKNAIEMFNVQEGRYPKDLNELAEKKYIPKIPEVPHGMKIDYDAATGSVKIVKQ